MLETTPSDTELKGTQTSHPFLLVAGVASVSFAMLLTARIIWEETSLTLLHGPQMIGFSLAHGGGAILFLAPVILVIWFVVAVIVIVLAFFRRQRISTRLWVCLTSAILIFGVMSLPPVFYQWLFIRPFAKSVHAPDLVVYAAGEGDARTVRRYLSSGVSIEAHDYEGVTPAFAAAARGNTALLEMLAAKGANLNALNDYGDSPLEAASRNHQGAAVAFLKAHGALQIKGTEEQRQAAADAIVRRQMH